MKFALLIISFCILTGCTYSAKESELIEKCAQTILLAQKNLKNENARLLTEMGVNVAENGYKKYDVGVLNTAIGIDLVFNKIQNKNDTLAESDSNHILKLNDVYRLRDGKVLNNDSISVVNLSTNHIISKLIIADTYTRNEFVKQRLIYYFLYEFGTGCDCFQNIYGSYKSYSEIVENGSFYKADLMWASSYGCCARNWKINEVFVTDKSISFKKTPDSYYSFQLVAKPQETKNDTVHIPVFMNVQTSYFKDTTFSTDINYRIIRR
jgi:hypothetical protein